MIYDYKSLFASKTTETTKIPYANIFQSAMCKKNSKISFQVSKRIGNLRAYINEIRTSIVKECQGVSFLLGNCDGADDPLKITE